MHCGRRIGYFVVLAIAACCRRRLTLGVLTYVVPMLDVPVLDVPTLDVQTLDVSMSSKTRFNF